MLKMIGFEQSCLGNCAENRNGRVNRRRELGKGRAWVGSWACFEEQHGGTDGYLL